MKKTIAKAILGLLIYSCTPGSTHAQGFSGGAKLGYDIYFGADYKPMTLGFFGERYNDDETGGFRLLFEYAFPKTLESTYTAYALSSASDPQSIDVAASTKVNAMSFALDYRRFMGEGEYSEGGFYFFLGGGLTFISTSTKLNFGSYSSTEYDVSGISASGEKEKYLQPMLRGGLGYEINIDPMKLFFEGRLSLPANRVNGMAVDINIGPFAGISAGVRF